MRVTFSLPAVKISPSSLVLGEFIQGTSIKSSLYIENLANNTQFNLKVGKLLNSECFLFNEFFDYRESQALDIITKGGNLGHFSNILVLTVAEIYRIKVPVEYEVIPQQKGTFLTTAFQEKTDSNFNAYTTIQQVDQNKNKKKYGVTAFRRGPVKNKSSISLFQGPLTHSSLRNSSATKIRDHCFMENQTEEDCLVNERRAPSAYSKKYPLFVTRKIDKYQPFLESRESKKLQKSKNCKDYFACQIYRFPKNRKET